MLLLYVLSTTRRERIFSYVVLALPGRKYLFPMYSLSTTGNEICYSYVFSALQGRRDASLTYSQQFKEALSGEED